MLRKIYKKGKKRFIGSKKIKEKEFKKLESNLDQATRHRDQTFAERHEKIDQQEKRNRRGKLLGDRGGIPRILLGGMKRRAQVTTGKVDASTLEKANEGVREAYEAFQELKLNPLTI